MLPLDIGIPPAIPSQPRRYFIADAHLDGSDNSRAEKFREFLKRLTVESAQRTIELYVLGDLFAFWYEYRAPLFDIYRRDIEALESAWKANVRIYLFSGNHDFAYGRYAREHFGATMLGDGEQILLSDYRPAWLEHGDLLCTADRSYLRYRAIIRSWPVRLLFWLMPWALARRIIDYIQRKSAADKQRKLGHVFDIDLAAACVRLKEKNCRLLICGHTHRPITEDLGAGLRLVVLPAWREQAGGYVDDGGSLQSFSLE
ncbi:MAG: UDP-2,3-diacylglucosamine diphosphatase [Planctomycetota bacterium]